MVRPAGERFPARIQRGPDPSNQIDEHVSTEIVAISLQFFVQLYSYKVQTESVERQAALVMGGAGGGGGGEGGGALPWLRTQTRRCADEADVDAADAGCVFDAIVDLLKRMQDDLLKKVVDAVMLEVKAKSQPYRLDKCVSAEFFFVCFRFYRVFFFVWTARWASLPSADAYLQPSLSPTGSSMLQAVALGLQWMQDSLASSLFREAWQQLAAQLNDVIGTPFLFYLPIRPCHRTFHGWLRLG